MSEDNNVEVSEETKTKVAEELGLDPFTDGDLIEKLALKETVNQKELSKAIDKKAEYREAGVKAGILDPETFKPIEKKPDGDITLKTNNNQDSSLEVTKFFARGGSDEEYATLMRIKGNRTLDEAQKDPAYVAFKESQDAKIASEKAQLGASSGLPIAFAKKDKDISEMSNAEHQALINKTLDGIPG